MNSAQFHATLRQTEQEREIRKPNGYYSTLIALMLFGIVSLSTSKHTIVLNAYAYGKI